MYDTVQLLRLIDYLVNVDHIQINKYICIYIYIYITQSPLIRMQRRARIQIYIVLYCLSRKFDPDDNVQLVLLNLSLSPPHNGFLCINSLFCIELIFNSL